MWGGGAALKTGLPLVRASLVVHWSITNIIIFTVFKSDVLVGSGHMSWRENSNYLTCAVIKSGYKAVVKEIVLGSVSAGQLSSVTNWLFSGDNGEL